MIFVLHRNSPLSVTTVSRPSYCKYMIYNVYTRHMYPFRRGFSLHLNCSLTELYRWNIWFTNNQSLSNQVALHNKETLHGLGGKGRPSSSWSTAVMKIRPKTDYKSSDLHLKNFCHCLLISETESRAFTCILKYKNCYFVHFYMPFIRYSKT